VLLLAISAPIPSAGDIDHLFAVVAYDAQDPRGRCLDQIVVWAMLDREAFTLAELILHLTSLAGRTAVPVDALQSSLQRLDLAFILGEDAGVYSWRVPLFRTRRQLEAPGEQLREQLSRLETLQAQMTPVSATNPI
jgi:hypothetical protein